jgi:crotonobetainyl-CoA:carnitine CoA-transferase CaiB-like acyl-CoA transferase
VAGGMLEGIRVIDLTSVVVGPLCTQILADHGAQVTKVESPQGDIGRYLGGRGRHVGMAPKFLHLNRNKRSICLDLKHPAGHAALLRLLADADVLVWNVRPDSMARLKLSYDDVRAVNPRHRLLRHVRIRAARPVRRHCRLRPDHPGGQWCRRAATRRRSARRATCRTCWPIAPAG